MAFTSITNVRIFGGDTVLPARTRTLTLDGPTIHSIGEPAPEGATIIDGNGGTLLPGLIYAHTHTSAESLRDALRFGVTTDPRGACGPLLLRA